MLFGKSLFQSVVDRLAEEEPDEDLSPREPHFRIDGLGASFAPERVSAAPEDENRRREAYLFLMGEAPEAEPPPAPPEPTPPDWLGRLSIEEIVVDLAITLADDRETLNEKRRAFARLNHPDRIHPDFRDQATTRMKIANLLVDEALLRCR
ncbi:hypothetical protein [Rhizobium glycinendophyticum]|uniref:J domain-containing protein n=1 Tax=Rhizobium glycinendophyticum TaxID=2589807 RepID=A0A504UDG4_9HYPH|nr:hypothetical protein [Rhizobium glycinendophyticum]TPP11787.1 hypothetical protein FJQ55_13615 [Rhizobium glycinendophyticum]